jgi:hypothetical protein
MSGKGRTTTERNTCERLTQQIPLRKPAPEPTQPQCKGQRPARFMSSTPLIASQHQEGNRTESHNDSCTVDDQGNQHHGLIVYEG